MDKQQFEQKYKVLAGKLVDIQKQENGVRDEIKVLKQAYIDTFPFKVNDKVSVKRIVYNQETKAYESATYIGWIQAIGIMYFINDFEVNLIMNKPKKDGTRSLVPCRCHNVNPFTDVEIINRAEETPIQQHIDIEAYIDTLPFKVNDCVRIYHRLPLYPQTAQHDKVIVEKCWIKEIKAFDYGQPNRDPEITIVVDQANADGTRPSKGGERIYSVKLTEVEVINE